jgi:hypothetical protein
MGESSCRAIDCVCYVQNREIQRISGFEHQRHNVAKPTENVEYRKPKVYPDSGCSKEQVVRILKICETIQDTRPTISYDSRSKIGDSIVPTTQYNSRHKAGNLI